MSGAAPATDIAGILAAPNSCARPSHAGLPGSVAELSCQKIVLDLQLANLAIQKIDLSFIDGSLRRSSTLEDARRTVQQLLLPVVDLVGMDPNSPASSATVRSPLIAASATLALNPAPCFFRARFMSCSCAIRAF